MTEPSKSGYNIDKFIKGLPNFGKPIFCTTSASIILIYAIGCLITD